jgi:hypothetical protein
MNEFGKTPGLEWFKLYSGKVTENDDSTHEDGRKLCRIRVRVPVIFEGIEDDALPWCIPFTDYSIGESADWGKGSIPPKDSKVLIAFQGGSLYHPVYMSHHVDEQVFLEEMIENYPHRRVALLPNKFLAVVDTKSNDVFIRNPGRMSIYIIGNADLTVTGNLTEKVMGNRHVFVQGSSIEHIEGDRIVHVNGNEQHVVEQGRSDTVYQNEQRLVGGTGSTHVNGNSIHVTGMQRFVASGSDNMEVYAGSSGRWVGGNDGLYSSGNQIRMGMTIHDNTLGVTPGSPTAPPPPTPPDRPQKPVILEWNGVRWEQPKDTN